MKAIQIKFLPATNHKPARIKAFTEGGNSIIINYNHGLASYTSQVYIAARELVEKMGWDLPINGIGQLPNGDWVATLGD